MKVHGPMMSLAAWGRVRLPYSMCNWIYPYGFQSYAIFQRRRTWHGMVTVLERYYTPYNPRSPAQQSQRGKFAAAVYAWQQLPPAEKYAFDALKYPIRMSGFNRFISQYVKTSVGIMVSGAGDESFNGEYNDNGAVSEGQPV